MVRLTRLTLAALLLASTAGPALAGAPNERHDFGMVALAMFCACPVVFLIVLTAAVIVAARMDRERND